MVIAKRKVKKPVYNTSTIKNMDYNWAPGPEPPNNQEIGVPKAVFVPHSNSLPFEERRVTLEQPVKIGRNVYRATPSPTNTIFECRVLSRHHATLYYDKGHFYLVDNQSSNGTFINNNRCSISKEQEPHEVFSGDVVQFGIPVVENATNSEKNTFPPVVALLKLFHPDGKEAKLSFNPTMTTPLHLKELYQLNNFVQEAIQREASLESRLRALRECVQRTQAEARASWELFVGEQRLLMRVHTLETMLAAGKQPEAAHVAQLLHDKKNYQEVATESLRAAHEQRLALEETLERRGRETAALLEHNAALRLAANNATAELQKLAARCERKMCAARLAIAAAEERELAARNQLPLAYSVQNGEAKMLVLSTDSNKLAEAKRTGSLEDAVRALPDYIKMLLPQHLLNKVGIKAISAEGKSAKEFELILKKNNIYDEESKDPDRDVSSSPLDGELHADNNANSTYTEPETEESPTKGGVEYANILRVMAGLNEEIRALRERVAAGGAEAEQLRAVRDELLAARAEPEPPPALDDLRAAHAKIDDLQAQLKRSAAVEEANLAEIQRLASSAAWMQAELAFRPTRAHVDELTADVAALRADLQARDAALERLAERPDAERPDAERPDAERPDAEPPRSPPAVATADKAVETERPVEDLCVDDSADAKKISADIDEMFRLDYDDDDTESVATEIDTAPGEIAAEPLASERLQEEERLAGQLANGSLHALQEELVRAKESWAEVCAERARLATQLAELQHKPRLLAPHLLAVALPLLAAALYWLLPYLS
ncbi:sarcolemmal membrane-associated protein isoform X2 [Cydia pomonella]|uniref:sarcolemmal membrane-associated protein isoform X2 n=1 Tax=Cydia pomonella TaxID=82600 RepID=UPI002ADD7B06|nr:sarcolemmal membrane-associated protein isoform X2 [Cydia pomonella]